MPLPNLNDSAATLPLWTTVALSLANTLLLLLAILRQRPTPPSAPTPPPTPAPAQPPTSTPASAPIATPLPQNAELNQLRQRFRHLLDPLQSRGQTLCDFLLDGCDKNSQEAILCLHNLIAINAIQNLANPTAAQLDQLFFALHHFPRNFTALARGANCPETKICQWLNSWCDALRDPQNRYTLKLPTLGASVQNNWMSAPNGVTTVSAIESWAVYQASSLKHNAFVH